MLEIDPRAREKYDETWKFARSHGIAGRLAERINYLDTYGSDTVCVLYPDWAAHSLSFVMFRVENGERRPWFNGGLIYHGPGGDDSITVDLSSDESAHWGVHT